MVCMNKLFNQQYFKYLYKSNRRLLILIWAILFICICFFTTIFTINDFTAYSEVQTFVTAMSGFCGISISMFVPIYFFRFLYRKRSCDLYFGLPIRKKELFSTTFLFGYPDPDCSILFINFDHCQPIHECVILNNLNEHQGHGFLCYLHVMYTSYHLLFVYSM